jgi:hypothetical protein
LVASFIAAAQQYRLPLWVKGEKHSERAPAMLNAQLLQLPGRVGKMQRIGVRPRQQRAERL